jgi:hypothetical protein
MIGRKGKPSAEEFDKPKGFDDFELRLGDMMRGERATLSKSLLDVQRELRIKASYIAAIENTDASAFETPGFIAGYVRSYARYLGMDPDTTFERFCIESGFMPTHGMAAAASGPKPQRRPADPVEALANPNAIFVPRPEGFWAKFEPRALGSVFVLALLAGGLGYGGWTVLQEVQRVQLAPVDQAPGVVTELDPVENAQTMMAGADPDALPQLTAPEGLDRLYRPQALDVPVLVARDGPISAIDPRSGGTFGSASPAPTQVADAGAAVTPENAVVRTVAPDAPEVELLAVRAAWVRVQAKDGTVIFEKILDAGERFALPKLEEPPVLRAGNSGSVYFAVNGETYGPAASGANVVKNVTLSPDALREKYQVADLSKDSDLAHFVALAAAEPMDGVPAAETTE